MLKRCKRFMDGDIMYWLIERIYIKQEFMPGIPGKQGFKSADDALLVGNLVIKKISSNQPPIITTRDLDSLGIVKK